MSAQEVVVAALALARAGVDYSPKDGAVCPCCGMKRIKVRNTKPWDGDFRVRFHVCTNPRCALCKLKQPVKSIQANPTVAQDAI